MSFYRVRAAFAGPPLARKNHEASTAKASGLFALDSRLVEGVGFAPCMRRLAVWAVDAIACKSTGCKNGRRHSYSCWDCLASSGALDVQHVVGHVGSFIGGATVGLQ
ncbi:hypothetical protein DF111_01450 [Burkholderia stagnalis]|nr:hypothetical protein DF111_01450 [Burkholderia stagnalis]